MKIKLLPFIINITLAISVFSSSVTYAQKKAQVSTDSALNLEVIEITSRKWQENTYQTPITLDVFTNVNQIDLADITSRTGNVAFEQSSVQTRTVIRGVSSYDTSLQEPVAYYYNNVALPLGGNQLPKLANLQQIEIIKGSQGSLYGRNSQAGVINIISQRPTNTPTGFVSFTYGQQDGAVREAPVKDLGIYVSNEIIDSTLNGSVYVAYRDEEGPFYNQYLLDDKVAEQKQSHINGQFEWQVKEETTVKFFVLQENNNNGKGQLRYQTGLLATDRFVVNYDTSTYDNNEIDLYGLSIDHTFNDLVFTSITGFTDYQRNFKADLDLSPFPIPSTLMSTSDKTLSQEFRLANVNNINVKWLVGAYLYQQDTDTNFTIGGSQQLARSQRITNIEQDSMAIFSQVDWQLMPKWWLTVGVRFESLEQKGQQGFIRNLVQSDYRAILNSDELLTNVSLRYELNSNQMLFTLFSQGYMPGGYNYGSAQGVGSFIYGNENSNNYEIGYKGKFLDNNLAVNLSLFHTEIKNKQIVDLLPGFVQSVSNAAHTTNKGVELSLHYNITENLLATAHYALLDAITDEYQVSIFNGTRLIDVNLSGNRLPLAARHTYGLSLQYWLADSFFLKINAQGSGDYFFDINNTIEQAGYVKINTELSYEYNNLTLSLTANNLTDEEVVSRAVNTPAGIAVEDAAPRYFAVNVRYNW